MKYQLFRDSCILDFRMQFIDIVTDWYKSESGEWTYKGQDTSGVD